MRIVCKMRVLGYFVPLGCFCAWGYFEILSPWDIVGLGGIGTVWAQKSDKKNCKHSERF